MPARIWRAHLCNERDQHRDARCRDDSKRQNSLGRTTVPEHGMAHVPRATALSPAVVTGSTTWVS